MVSLSKFGIVGVFDVILFNAIMYMYVKKKKLSAKNSTFVLLFVRINPRIQNIQKKNIYIYSCLKFVLVSLFFFFF